MLEPVLGCSTGYCGAQGGQSPLTPICHIYACKLGSLEQQGTPRPNVPDTMSASRKGVAFLAGGVVWAALAVLLVLSAEPLARRIQRTVMLHIKEQIVWQQDSPTAVAGGVRGVRVGVCRGRGIGHAWACST